MRYTMISLLMLFGLVHTAQARGAYVGPLNAGLGNGAAVSCGACHSGTPSGGSAVLPMARTWASGASLALSDSDGDGFNNAQEVNGGSTAFNYPNITPFTLATGGKALANVYVVGDAQAVEVPAPTSLVIPPGSQLMGNTAIDIYADPTLTAPITLTYKAGGVAATSTVYAIDTYSNAVTALVAGTDWVANPNGSLTIKQLPTGASAATHNLAVVRVIPVVPPAGAPRGGEGEEGFEGCVSPALPMPLMLLVLLALGFGIRRKSM